MLLLLSFGLVLPLEADDAVVRVAQERHASLAFLGDHLSNPFLQARFQRQQVFVEVLRVLVVGHAVDSRCGTAFESAKRLAEHPSVEEAGKPPETMLRVLPRFDSRYGQGA